MDRKGKDPDLSTYLVLEKLVDKEGPWVLMDGYVDQNDTKAEREIFVFPRCFFVKKADANEIIKQLKNTLTIDSLIFQKIFTLSPERSLGA